MAARKVLMVEPKHFISNPETVGDNFFQQPGSDSQEDLTEIAKKEFAGIVNVLKSAGIEVHIFRQDDDLKTPDALFPNNWFSTIPGGTCILYPMMAPNRRLERRANIRKFLSGHYARQIDLTHDEDRGLFLEGTGSLVMDHENRVAYGSLSQRTSSNMAFEWSKLTGYEIVLFTSYDRDRQTIYHTNVMMCIAGKFAIVCLDALEDDDARERVQLSLERTGHEIIEITFDQMHHFCGNCLELENKKEEKFLCMSAQAFGAFTDLQKKQIEKHCTILQSEIHTIETAGGGGVRCMLAELY